MKKEALIIFTKNPEIGKVKTRIAKTLGNQKALEIYTKLLLQTEKTVASLLVDKFVFYSDTVLENDIWEIPKYQKKVQNGIDLGDRMKNSFQEIFNLSYDSVCIIGSDCFELNSDIICSAFDNLNKSDVTIGPTFDGGYYLLGMNKQNSKLFENMIWSTETVFADTVKKIKNQNLNYVEMVKLNDVDEAGDVPRIWL